MNRRVVTWVGVDQVGAGWEEKCPLNLTRCRGWYGPGGEEDDGRDRSVMQAKMASFSANRVEASSMDRRQQPHTM